jgi:hypothetical protein
MLRCHCLVHVYNIHLVIMSKSVVHSRFEASPRSVLAQARQRGRQCRNNIHGAYGTTPVIPSIYKYILFLYSYANRNHLAIAIARSRLGRDKISKLNGNESMTSLRLGSAEVAISRHAPVFTPTNKCWLHGAVITMLRIKNRAVCSTPI